MPNYIRERFSLRPATLYPTFFVVWVLSHTLGCEASSLLSSGLRVLDDTFHELSGGGPDAFDFMDLDRDGEISRAEFEQAEHNGLQVTPGVWKHPEPEVHQPAAKEAVAAVATNSTQEMCDSARAFNESLQEARKLSEQVYQKLTQSHIQVVAEEKAEGAALASLSELQKSAVEGIRACDERRDKALHQIEIYRKELEDLEKIVNSTKSIRDMAIGMHSLLARKSVLLQLQGTVDESEDITVALREALHHQVDKAAEELKACKRRGVDSASSAVISCAEEEAHLNSTFSHVQGTIAEMIKVAERRSEDSCHTAVMAEFETGRVRLESAVATAQRRICDALSLGEEAVDDFDQLKAKFNETSQLLTGPCVEMSSKNFQQVVAVIEELFTHKPRPQHALEKCKLLPTNTTDVV